MKIGILSMQRIINHGSFLQAYALKSIFNELGNDVEFIDIESEIIDYKTKFKFPYNAAINDVKAYIHKLLGQKDVYKSMMYDIKPVKYTYLRAKKFYKILKKHLKLSRYSNLNSSYDAVIIGSDEVFNCTQKCSWTNSMKLFGEGFNTNILLSYAGSFGTTTYEKIKQNNLIDAITYNFSKFNSISVRDRNSIEIVNKLGFNAIEHLDPVLVYDYNSHVKDNDKLKNIFIIYCYYNRLVEKDIIDEVKKIANNENLRIVSLCDYYSWCDENPIISPFEVLNYFYNAKYILTDTFHGTVFSIKFNKQYASIIREGNKQKLGYLIEKFNQQDSVLNQANDLYSILNNERSYDEVNKIISIESERTKKFFQIT